MSNAETQLEREIRLIGKKLKKIYREQNTGNENPVDLLKLLDSLTITKELLSKTLIHKTVKKLSKRAESNLVLKKQAETLLNMWERILHVNEYDAELHKIIADGEGKGKRAIEILTRLLDAKVDIDILTKTRIAKTVNTLRKTTKDKDVAMLGKVVIVHFRAMLAMFRSEPHISAATGHYELF